MLRPEQSRHPPKNGNEAKRFSRTPRIFTHTPAGRGPETPDPAMRCPFRQPPAGFYCRRCEAHFRCFAERKKCISIRFQGRSTFPMRQPLVAALAVGLCILALAPATLFAQTGEVPTPVPNASVITEPAPIPEAAPAPIIDVPSGTLQALPTTGAGCCNTGCCDTGCCDSGCRWGHSNRCRGSRCQDGCCGLGGRCRDGCCGLKCKPYPGTPKSDLFYNYYVPKTPCGGMPAGMYPCPGPTPPIVGQTYYTYQPLLPHEMMYPHCRHYLRVYDKGLGVNLTNVHWKCSPLHSACSKMKECIRIPR